MKPIARLRMRAACCPRAGDVFTSEMYVPSRTVAQPRHVEKVVFPTRRPITTLPRAPPAERSIEPGADGVGAVDLSDVCIRADRLRAYMQQYVFALPNAARVDTMTRSPTPVLGPLPLRRCWREAMSRRFAMSPSTTQPCGRRGVHERSARPFSTSFFDRTEPRGSRWFC